MSDEVEYSVEQKKKLTDALYARRMGNEIEKVSKGTNLEIILNNKAVNDKYDVSFYNDPSIYRPFIRNEDQEKNRRENLKVSGYLVETIGDITRSVVLANTWPNDKNSNETSYTIIDDSVIKKYAIKN